MAPMAALIAPATSGAVHCDALLIMVRIAIASPFSWTGAFS